MRTLKAIKIDRHKGTTISFLIGDKIFRARFDTGDPAQDVEGKLRDLASRIWADGVKEKVSKVTES